MGVSIESVE